CNPNIIDSLYTPEWCVLLTTPIGQLIRENRSLFLSKRAYHTFSGYANSQAKKIRDKNPVGKRKATVEQYGFDVKYAYHLIRLIDECKQIFTTGTIDLQLEREKYKAIRRGDWSLDKVLRYFSSSEEELRKLYVDSKLIPYEPDEDK